MYISEAEENKKEKEDLKMKKCKYIWNYKKFIKNMIKLVLIILIIVK